MVGHSALDLGIGVRIPVSQPKIRIDPFSYVVEGFFICGITTVRLKFSLTRFAHIQIIKFLIYNMLGFAN